MSRIGQKPVKIESGVTVTVNGSNVKVAGPKGTLEINVLPEVAVKTKDGEVFVEVVIQNRQSSAYSGLTRSLINNMVKGVAHCFEKKLELVGVGYRAKMAGSNVSLSVGFSHPVEFVIPSGVVAEVLDNQTIVLKGADKQLVGQVAANIRKVRPPEPYKGKGIKYSGEFIRRKQGKSGKV